MAIGLMQATVSIFGFGIPGYETLILAILNTISRAFYPPPHNLTPMYFFSAACIQYLDFSDGSPCFMKYL